MVFFTSILDLFNLWQALSVVIYCFNLIRILASSRLAFSLGKVLSMFLICCYCQRVVLSGSRLIALDVYQGFPALIASTVRFLSPSAVILQQLCSSSQPPDGCFMLCFSDSQSALLLISINASMAKQAQTTWLAHLFCPSLLYLGFFPDPLFIMIPFESYLLNKLITSHCLNVLLTFLLFHSHVSLF